MASPRRGFYLIVPPEYRIVGAPPASWFVDELMRHLGQPYYVGILTAAAIHGAAHQQPMVFQVVTSKPTRDVRVGKVTIRFSTSTRLERMPVVKKQTETGTMRLATPETCAFDLVRYPSAAGYPGNVAVVLSELFEQLDPGALVEIAPIVRLPDVQRLGFLLDWVEAKTVADGLARWLRERKPRLVALRPGGAAAEGSGNRWLVYPNVDFEEDR